MSKRAKILIVDDETGPRESLKMVLKPFYDVFTANGRQDALTLLQSTPMDLVTLDLKMADCHGTALLKEIKCTCPNTQAIILTGYGTLKSAIEAIRLGASDYLLKPFQVTEILSVINRVLTRPIVSGQMEAALHELERVAESSHP
jgi:putative two-component system response regulator